MHKLEAEEIFEGVCKDPQTWLAQANQLKMSADVIEVELQDVMLRIRFEQGLDQPFLAFLKSFMLLTGMAMENLIKGILVGRNPSIESHKVKWLLGKKKGGHGHGISEGAKELIGVSKSEYELLRGLEEYLVWAGRYQMPSRSEDFLNSQRPENLLGFSWEDFELIDKLFDRLAEILDNEWSACERSRREMMERPEGESPGIEALSLEER
jgi:hypothetical protein